MYTCCYLCLYDWSRVDFQREARLFKAFEWLENIAVNINTVESIVAKAVGSWCIMLWLIITVYLSFNALRQYYLCLAKFQEFPSAPDTRALLLLNV